MFNYIYPYITGKRPGTYLSFFCFFFYISFMFLSLSLPYIIHEATQRSRNRFSNMLGLGETCLAAKQINIEFLLLVMAEFAFSQFVELLNGSTSTDSFGQTITLTISFVDGFLLKTYYLNTTEYVSDVSKLKGLIQLSLSPKTFLHTPSYNFSDSVW